MSISKHFSGVSNSIYHTTNTESSTINCTFLNGVKDEADLALKKIATLVLENCTNSISDGERELMEKLNQKNFTKEQVGCGIKFIQDAQNQGFIKIVSDKQVDINCTKKKIIEVSDATWQKIIIRECS